MTVYCNDDGSNTSPYETLAKAATTFLVAVDQLVTGEDLLIGMDHTEAPGGSVTYAFPGAAAAPNRVISINTTTEAYDKADNVQVDTSSAGTFNISITGHVKLYGVSFKVGNDLVAEASPADVLLCDSEIELTRNNSEITWGAASGKNIFRLKNTNVNFSTGGTSCGFAQPSSGIFGFKGGVLSWTGTQPTSLFRGGGRSAVLNISGVDLSVITSAIVLVSSSGDTLFDINNCLLNSGVAFTTGTIVRSSSKFIMSGCDDTTGNDLYRLEYVDYYGTTIDIDTIFVTTGAASDGTTPISWKMVTTANATEFSEPHIGPPIPLWIDSTVQQTFTVKLIWDSASDIQTDECWLELEYLDASVDPQSAFANDGLANVLASPVDQDNNTETWTGVSGFSDQNKIDLTVTATPGRVGPAIARVHLAKPSTTVYIDPKVVAVAT